MLRIPRLFLCLSLALAVACKPDPASLKDQTAILKKKGATTKEKLKAIENLRKLDDRGAVPTLVASLKTSSPKVKGELAALLAEFKEPSSILPMVEAFDYDPDPQKASEIEAMNEKIAKALGDIGGKAATKGLLALVRQSQNNYTKLAALNALAKIADPAAAAPLGELAFDTDVEGPINKKAMATLAATANPESLPVFLKGLYFQRGSLSLYSEASFGLFRLRGAAYPAVRDLLSGADKATIAFAKEKEVSPAAIQAIAAQVAGQVRDPKSIPLLVKQLSFRDPDPNMAMLARMAAVDALGRIRASQVVPRLVSMIDSADRDKVVTALVRIGDRSVLPRLAACSTRGGWSEREACIHGVALLGGKKELALVDGYLRDEPKRYAKECKEGLYGEIDCAKEQAGAMADRSKVLNAYKAALETVSACSDVPCLAKALASSEPATREKAAYEAVALGDVDVLPALIEAITAKVKIAEELPARLAAVLAVDWMVADDEAARAKLKGEPLKSLQAAVERDRNYGVTAESAEEIQILVEVVQRGRAKEEPPAQAAKEESE